MYTFFNVQYIAIRNTWARKNEIAKTHVCAPVPILDWPCCESARVSASQWVFTFSGISAIISLYRVYRSLTAIVFGRSCGQINKGTKLFQLLCWHRSRHCDDQCWHFRGYVFGLQAVSVWLISLCEIPETNLYKSLGFRRRGEEVWCFGAGLCQNKTVAI